MTTIVEEWGSNDRTTGEHRALDILAQRELAPSSDRLAPQLILLVECKRSDLPYVFFAAAMERAPAAFPKSSALLIDISHYRSKAREVRMSPRLGSFARKTFPLSQMVL